MDIALKKEIILSKAGCRLFGVIAGVIRIALGAFVRIPLPFTPVPITLQTFFVLWAALALGGSLASATSLIYIGLGAAGAPIFAQAASGSAYWAGPTAGYLWGFVLAGFLAGRFIRYARGNFSLILAVVFSAEIVILLCGTLWLKFILGYPLMKLLWIGFFPFLPGDFLKAVAAAWLFQKTRGRLREIFS